MVKQEKSYEETFVIEFQEKLGKNHRFQEHNEIGKKALKKHLVTEFFEKRKNHRFQEHDETGKELWTEFLEKLRKNHRFQEHDETTK